MKKTLLIFILAILAGHTTSAQMNAVNGIHINELPVVYLPKGISVHFVSPEPIQYVDISSKAIAGDLPVKNVLRIKYMPDSLKKAGFSTDAVVTITGEKFLAQYHIIYTGNDDPRIKTDIEILPEQTRPLDISGVGLSERELKANALSLLQVKSKGHLQKSKAYGITMLLNRVYTLDEYIFLDLSFLNSTNLKFDADQLRFKIDDRKVTKASTVQSVEIKPAFVLFDLSGFKKQARNVYVFKKFSFPGNKLLKIEMSEKQISGRVITLSIKYGDILEADIVPKMK